MSRFAIDTNVPVVANGRIDSTDGGRAPSVECRIASVEFLVSVLKSHVVVLDIGGEIQAEYRRNLNPSGQPGVGDRFYQEVLHSNPDRVERVALAKEADGEYTDLPKRLIAISFHSDDRKFAALARKEGIPVATSTDSDWLMHKTEIERNGIDIQFVCGCVAGKWFKS
jgi:hypothetical protein